jgi:uncharacterized coiled-coil DUF342 family protein
VIWFLVGLAAIVYVAWNQDKHISRLSGRIDDLEHMLAEHKRMSDSLHDDILGLQDRIRENEREIFELTHRRSPLDDDLG